MRVNVTLGDEDLAGLVKVMASMPAVDTDGHPVTIGPAKALRYALKKVAARLPASSILTGSK